ncbi:hypothetical protein DFQ27_006170 [Actinomortierella ambigua]|uniref:GATA-type domain-containing protein n=1 Tax=Actinomortierella ambigua TaxID=1343610 RepID=A0A9P6PZY2_9FUNG|nr:hypothetical protein DFQ27_006170 [Actinomortierella ambigua]
MASRKRVAAEVAKKPKPVFPTSHSPHPASSSNVERMSIADSAILRASLTQSRYNWTHSAFSKFTPEPAPRIPGQQGSGSGGKRYISEVTPAGVYTVCIGPHMFFETKFFTVYTPPPPAPPIATLAPSNASTSASTSSAPAGAGATGAAAAATAAGASSNNTAVSTPTDLPSSPSHVITGGSPAPERVIELILARTSTPTPFEEEAKETDGGAKSLPSELAGQRELETTLMESIHTLEPVVMDSNKNNFAHVHGISASSSSGGMGASGGCGGGSEVSSRAGTPALGSNSGVGGGSSGSKRAGGSSSMLGGSQSSRPPRPERQVAFEFKDNPGHRWLFPQEASVDFTPAGEGAEYGKVSASFCLPVYDDHKMSIPPGQMTTMVIVGPSQSLYEGILAAVNDPTVTYKALMDKMKQIPPRAYPEYQLPVDYPDEKLEPLGLKKLPDHKVVPLASLQPSKRKPDGHQEIPSAKHRRSNKAGAGSEETTTSHRPSGSQRRGMTSTGAPAVAAASSSLASASTGATAAVALPSTSPGVMTSNSASSVPLAKRCVYCGCTTTPMWRRGPAGPSTLCNACGVKWKNGKILQETPKPPSGKSRGQHSSTSSSTAAVAAASLSSSIGATSSTMALQASSSRPASTTSHPTASTTLSNTLGGTLPAIGVAASALKRGGGGGGAVRGNGGAGGPQKTTVEAAAELLKNFVEAVNNPRSNGMTTTTAVGGGGHSMSRSSSTRGSNSGSKRSSGAGGAGGSHVPTSTKRDASQMSENSVASESEGSRISEAEKMVPVKKRHSSRAQAAVAAAVASSSPTSASTSTSTPTSAVSQGAAKVAPSAQTGEQGPKNSKGSSSGSVSAKESAKSTKTNNAGVPTASTPAASASTSVASTPAATSAAPSASPTSSAASPATTGSALTSAATSPTTPSAPTVAVVTPTPSSTSTSAASTPAAGATTTTTTTTATTTITPTATTPTSSKGKASASKASLASTGSSRVAGSKAPMSSTSSASSPSSLVSASAVAGARGMATKAKANGTTTTATGATATTTTTTTSPSSSPSSSSSSATTASSSMPGTTTTPRPSPPTSAGAKLELLKAFASSPRYQISSHAAVAVSTMNLADDGLSLFATKNLYTNNTATFPLHFPTISIAFGPNNAYYTYPNCAVILYENHFQIKLIQAGERTQIDVWKEGIEGTEFQVVDVGDGESMIVFRAVLRQYMTRFDKELLNPDRNETLIVFRFRERLDGGGPPVKPLLEQWLTTEIPVPPPTTATATATTAATTTTTTVAGSSSSSPAVTAVAQQQQTPSSKASPSSTSTSPSSSVASTPAKAP